MIRLIKRTILVAFIVVVACIGLASCATGYYTSSSANQYATIVLRTVSDNTPIVEMVLETQTYRIPSEAIVRPYATVKKQQQYRLPAGKEVKLNFTYHWVGEELSYPRTHSSGVIEMIKIEQSKSMESCNASVSFIPELGKHYEVYFKFAMGSCNSWVK